MATLEERKLTKARKTGYGIGLLKGMAVTIKHLFKHNTVIQYPDEKQDLPARTRGVIALKEENCTVCMLCARECPDWCIYIDSHKEQLPPKREGGRPRKRNVLDRFAIDYALCMYCGICVEVCPYDALFWSREFEYSEYDIRELTHEKEKLSDWMATVLPPPELEVGAEIPGQSPAKADGNGAGAPATAAGAAGPGSAQRPAPPAAATAAAESPEQAQRQPAAAATAAPPESKASTSQAEAGETKADQPEGRAQATEEKAPAGEGNPEAATVTDSAPQPEGVKSSTEAASPEQFDRPAEDKAETTEPQRQPGTEAAATDASGAPHTTKTTEEQPSGQTDEQKGESAPGPALSDEDKAKYQESPGPNVEVPHEAPKPIALERTEDPDAVYQQVLQEQMDKGSSPQVAEARAKVARVKAERGIKRGPTPIETDKMVPSAPTKGQPTPQEPSGAPEAQEPKPAQGPVSPTQDESTADGATSGGSEAGATSGAGGDGDGAGSDDPEAVYERVLADEKAKGSSDAVAQGRAKAARVKAERAKKAGG